MEISKPSKERLRVASLQYFIGPVETFKQFRDQVDALPAVSINYGQAAILTPSDFAFSRDRILAEGDAIKR